MTRHGACICFSYLLHAWVEGAMIFGWLGALWRFVSFGIFRWVFYARSIVLVFLFLFFLSSTR